MSRHNQIDYVEFRAADLELTRNFYSRVFGWRFEDYGPDYISFQDGRIAGGFARDQSPAAPARWLLSMSTIFAPRINS